MCCFFQIMVYGRLVFMGYLNNEEKTRQALTSEGWLRSGDIGRIDEDGFLFITGRIKGEETHFQSFPLFLEISVLKQMELLIIIIARNSYSFKIANKVLETILHDQMCSCTSV